MIEPPQPRNVGHRVAAIVVLLLAAACRGRDTLRTLERVPLPDSVSPAATLALDSLGRAWVGDSARLSVLDSTGRAVTQLPVALRGAPRLLWLDSGRVYLRVDDAAGVVDAVTGAPGSVRRSGAPLARDPRRRWVYTATRTGSVLGLDPRSLAPRWGWPDAGSPVSALAVSPLGDRLYVALTGSDRNDVPPSIEVRDALSGRLLSVTRTSAPARRLEAAPDGTLYGLIGGDVVALRHGRAGLKPLWSRNFGGIGHPEADELRVSPSGARLAVVARGKALRLLSTADGTVLQEGKQSPRDVAWDAAGRLWVLGAREIRIVR
jgi:DNA-binding beta-propeller fold protein YncE